MAGLWPGLLLLLVLVSGCQGFLTDWLASGRRQDKAEYFLTSGCGGDWQCPSGKCLVLKRQFCNAHGLIQWLFKKPSTGCYYTKCAQCTQDKHCKPDEHCSGSRCQPVPPPPGECRFSISCKIWEQCSRDGVCEARSCNVDNDCPSNRECRRFQCTRRRSRKTINNKPKKV